MPVCVPIKDMRDTAAFARLVQEAPCPVTVTKNGYDQFVAMRSRDYDELVQAAAANRLMERMAEAERERAEERHVDASESIAAIRDRHGL